MAATSDDGQTWSSTIASGAVPLSFDMDKAPGISIAPDGIIDIVFYAHDAASRDCVLDVESWQELFPPGRIDPCSYNVCYTFSRDGSPTFGQPIQLNAASIRGESFIRLAGGWQVASHIAVASTSRYAYPI